MFAYVVRFLAVSLQTVESGLGKIRPSMDVAARSLGCQPRETLFKIHIPLMKGSILTALMIVFVDVMKELPMTLLLRPFNYETLSTYVYQFAKDELLEESALAALLIIIAGLGPVILINASQRDKT